MTDNFRVVDVNGLKIPKIPWRTAVLGAAVVAALATATSTAYQIYPEEVGVILRFGKYVRIFVDTVYK